jgi:heat shock protein HslJ
VTELEGRTWRLTSGVAPDPTAPITARFVDGTVSGTVGAAHYRASYDADGDGLRIGPPSFSARVDDRGLATLFGTVATARVDRDTLQLLDDAGTAVLTFEPAPEVDPRLVGRWMVTRVAADGDGDEQTGPTPEGWLEFAPDGTVTGHGGVNRFGSQARTDGDRLYLGPVRMTRMGGAPEAMAAETAVTDALGRVAGFRLDGDGLELRDPDGAVVVRLRRG